MKKKFHAVLSVLAIEAAHFFLLTGALCLLGFFTLKNGETPVTFKALLWTGTVSFWFDGYGPVLLLCLAVVVGSSIWDTCIAWLALDNRRKTLDAEVERKTDDKVTELRPKLEAAISKAYAEKYATREKYLSVNQGNLAAQRKELEVEMHMVKMGWIGLEEEQKKITAWKCEVEALRRKAAEEKERKASVRQRIRWACEALSECPSNVGLAARHLKKAEKL